MSESMSSPWIRDYLVDVAEIYGAQLYNAPVSKGKKKVQLTDFLTYQEGSYVWAWVSDKDYRVSVRISKDAIDEYEGRHGRNIIDCRFSLIFIADYRPMFSPRPLGPNILGNTDVFHISLEIGRVSLIGTGGHLFGNPRDLESDEKMKEWVLGLRQDGGGGNVLKLRKEQEVAQNEKAPPSPPSPPPFSLYAPVTQCQTAEAAEDPANPKHERPQDFKRAYAKRWRKFEIDPWKFAIKPVVEEQRNLTVTSSLPVEPRLNTANQVESCDRGSLARPTSPRRTPSPTPLQRQGTPTDWSPSNRGSPVAPEANIITSENGIQQNDEQDISGTRSLQPHTPAQRTRHSPLPRSSSPSCGSPEMITRSPVPSSQQLPRSSPPPPSSPRPPPPSPLPIPMGIRKNLQRKVPHPGHPVLRPDPANQGPVQVLVPNSDTSGTGSSQPHGQSQHCSQAPIFPVGRNDDKVQEKASPISVPRHDSEAWKEPSFIGKHKGKGKAYAAEEPDTPSVQAGKKRYWSSQAEPPVRKQAKASLPEALRAPSGWTATGILHETQHQDAEASALGKMQQNDGLSTSLTHTTKTAASPLALQMSKPRLANFVVDFEKIDLGKNVPIPRLDLDKGIKSTLLRTGRVRTLGEKVEKDGSVYIHL